MNDVFEAESTMWSPHDHAPSGPVQATKQVVLNELAGSYGLAPGAALGAWINGAVVEGEGLPVPLIDPATGEQILRYPDAGMHLVSEAANGAAAAQIEWLSLPGIERGRRMWAWAQAIGEAQASLAVLESANTGRPLAQCRQDVVRSIEAIEYYAGWCDKLDGHAPALSGDNLAYVTHQPFGIVAVILSWNTPLMSAVFQAAPALAAGNGVILKPSELTPLTTLILGLLASDAGLPRGLLQVVPGYGPTTGGALIVQDAVNKVVFSGDPITGSQVARASAERLKICGLQIDGKTVSIVCDDADFGQAVPGLLQAAFAPSGRGHLGTRLLVQRRVFDAFARRVVDAAAQMRIGMPMEAGTQIGPIISGRRLRQAQHLVDQSIADGAWIAGGHVPDLPSGGSWMAPIVLTRVPEQSALLREPIAAPVLTVAPFDTTEEAVEIANASRYVVAASIWTRDVSCAHHVARNLRAGTVWVNGFGAVHAAVPFGGISGTGNGRSSGRDALAEFTEAKAVWVTT